MSKKVLLTFGTRPEAIKMCPLVKELKLHNQFEVTVCVTGQHREMLKQVLDCFHISPDYDLDIMSDNQTLFDITTRVLNGMRGVLQKEKPDILLVHGDTTTTFASALAAFYLGIPIGHVEAGLRTYHLDSPFPEEFNRQGVGVLANLHFAPTQKAKDNLLREGKCAEQIFVTGNTAIDALKTTILEDYTHPELEWANGKRIILLTAHRRENLGEPLHHIFRAIRRIVEEFDDVRVIYPVHCNPQVKTAAKEELGGHPQVHLIEPLDVIDFHNFLKRCELILTDSGGIQEEAPSLGKPVLVLRDTTERPEGIQAGTLKLCGTNEDIIYKECKTLLQNSEIYHKMSLASNPYGDGTACKQIASILK